MKKILLLAVAGAFIMGCHDASAQRYALKTNAAVWATTSINAAFEVGLAQKTTLELGASYNPWIFSHNKKMRHWMFQPEFRYWTCGRFDRAFWGLHIMGGQFNAGGFNPPFDFYSELKKYRYQGI